jgi:hypothetical protein
MTDEPSHVDGVRSLGRIIERGMNIVRENFGTLGAYSGSLAPLRSDLVFKWPRDCAQESQKTNGKNGRSGEI